MEQQETRLIVRIMNKDLDGSLPVHRALMKIKGISHRTAKIIAYALEKEAGIPLEAKLGDLTEKEDKAIEGILASPEKHGMPKWGLNRRNDFETGQDTHLVMNDLDFSLRKDLERMKKIKSYKGVRHMYGLPARGQKTRSSFRKRGSSVGVVKKDAKQGKGPAKKEGK